MLGKSKYYLPLLTLASLASSCKLMAPAFGKMHPSQSFQLSTLDCASDWNFKTDKGSSVTWRVTKVIEKENNKEVDVSGTIGVDGTWVVKDKSMGRSLGEFEFDIASTNSQDDLRDIRIRKYFLEGANRLPMQFELVSSIGTAMDFSAGSSANLEVLGTLSIGGVRSSEIHVPLLVKSQGETITVTPMEVLRINLRDGSKPNGIGLSERAAHLMSFVPGVGLQDFVEIDFNLVFKNACPKP